MSQNEGQKSQKDLDQNMRILNLTRFIALITHKN